MIVVSDTSPLTALIAVGEEELLKTLFGEVNHSQCGRGGIAAKPLAASSLGKSPNVE